MLTSFLRRPVWAAFAAAVAACGSPDPITGPGADRVATVILTPARDTLTALGESVTLVAEARDADGAVIPDRTFLWTAADPAVATVASDGRVTAVAPGTTAITAQSGQRTATATIVVHQVVTGVSVAPATWLATAVGAAQQVTATPRDANNHPVAGRVITWASSDSAVATISLAGMAASVANGTATLTATVDEKSANMTVTVAQLVAAVTVDPDQWSPQALGEQQQFTAVAHDANGHEVADWLLAWQTADSSITQVGTDGMATATGVGATTVRAVSGAIAGTAAVNVAQQVSSVVVAPTSATLHALGDTLQLTAAALDANGQEVATAGFTWQSSNPAILTVSDSGRVTAVAEGAATVTASAGGQSAQATLTVAVSSGPAATQMFIGPDTWTATAAGAKQQFQVFATDASGNSVNVSPIAWSSSNPAVASTEANGLVTALTSGEAILTATSGALTSTALITVDASGAIANGVVWSMYFARQVESPAILTVGGALLTPSSPDQQPYPDGAVRKFQFEGDRIGVLTDVFNNVGSFRVRDRVGEWVDLAIASARDFQLEGNRIGVLLGDGTLRIKDGTHAAWTNVAGDGNSFQLEGNRIAVRNSDGSLHVKDGINGPWATLASSATAAYQLEGNRIGHLSTAGTFHVKEGINGAWTLLGNANTAAFALEGNRIAQLQTNGTFRVKDGINGAWTVLANGGVEKFQLDGNRIGILYTSGSFRVKDGINGGWTTLGSSVRDFNLHKGRIGMVGTDNLVRVKTGSPNAPWTYSAVHPQALQFRAAVPAPMAPGRTTPASYASAQAACASPCARAPYLPSPIQGWEWVWPVPVYGRNCGDNRPAPGTSQAWIDNMDRICYHHDRAPTWYGNATGSLSNDLAGACIVRYGILNARMTRDGALLAAGSTAERQAWGLMPNMREARRMYLDWTSSCTSGYMDQFEEDTSLDL